MKGKTVLLLAIFAQTYQTFALFGLDWFTEKWTVKSSSHSGRTKRQSGGDESTVYYEAQSSVLPTLPNNNSAIDYRQLPTLGNGHIGMVPYRPYFYMNGLYNGKGGKSHRAKIPTLNMGRIYLGSEQLESSAQKKFIMNAMDGYFMEKIECDFGYVEHKMYPHQHFTRVMVVSIYARGYADYFGGGTISLRYPSENSTADIRFDEKSEYYGAWRQVGRTYEAEDGARTQTMNMYFQTALREIRVSPGKEVNETFLVAVDFQQSAALTDFQNCLEILTEENGHAKLFRLHQEAWKETWERGMISVKGGSSSGPILEKIVHFSQYYILSNLPALNPSQRMPLDQYLYGVGRTSLAWGEEGVNYGGHIFWDSEMYILPAILPTHPDLAKEILRYRAEKRTEAEDNAKKYNEKGYRYPWESARSGNDVTPEGTCDQCRDRQIHVSGAVSYAIRQYFSFTWDIDYLNDQYYAACDITRETAKFYAEKMVFNDDGRYYLTDVMGPDDRADHQSNNAYVNTLASLAIHWGRYMACRCKRTGDIEVPEEYIMRALYVKLPFDNRRRLHYQFDGFEDFRSKNESYMVKQADTVMMGFPLNWNMSRDIWQNDLQYYKTLTDDDTPAMTYSFMTVGWKFVDDVVERDNFFERSYEDYVIQPFKVWTEYSRRSSFNSPAVNFLPGMGGFLQSVIYGFVGMRIRPEHLEFHRPMPPSGCDSITLSDVNYLNSRLTIFIELSGRDGTRAVLTVTDVDDEYNLVLVRNNTYGRGPEESLNPGAEVTIENAHQGFWIYTLRGTPCEHPRDYIYMPWGYSPWVSRASTHSSFYGVFVLFYVMYVVYVIIC